ncbi:MAG: hypothetical protein ACJA0Q_000880 [Saprospiraceae bacterium]|jgi:hypothetical protein
MIIYSITFAIETSIEKEWIEYMKSNHIPQLMASGYFTEFQHTKIIPEQGMDLAFNIQLTCESIDILEQYLIEKKENIEQELHQKYSGKFASFYTKLEKLQ